MTASGAALLLWLRGRWSGENLFKYASSHNGIDSIASYLMDVGLDDCLVALSPTQFARRPAPASPPPRRLSQQLSVHWPNRCATPAAVSRRQTLK